MIFHTYGDKNNKAVVTKGNESVAKKGALKMKELNPNMEIKRFDGMAHAELACFKQHQWIREVREFAK